MSLELRDVSVDDVLHNISLYVHDGEVMALVGPSGSGKTTLLNVISGFAQLSEGGVLVDDAHITDIPVQRRPVGMMLERPALFDMSVRANIEFALDDARQSPRQRHDLATIAMSSLNILGLADHHAPSLSAGQRQWVAFARTFVRRPRAVLLDEPLGHIEASVRADIHAELLNQTHRLGLAVLYVTHDIADACAVADRITVLEEGAVVQVGTPEELFFCPVSPSVARLMGVPNILTQPQARLILEPSVLTLDSPQFSHAAHDLDVHGKTGDGRGIQVVIAPSRINLRSAHSTNVVGSVGQVIRCTFARSHYEIDLETEVGTLVAWVPQPYRVGDYCEFSVTHAWQCVEEIPQANPAARL